MLIHLVSPLLSSSQESSLFELLILSYERRLYHHLFGVLRFHYHYSLQCTPITGQSLKFPLFEAYLLIAHFYNLYGLCTQDLTLCYLTNFFCFRHIHVQAYFILTLQFSQLQGFPAIQRILDVSYTSLHAPYEHGRLSTIF